MQIVAENVYHCSAEDFWAHHLDEESRRAKEVEGCGAVSYRVLSKQRKGKAITVRSEIVEEPDLPGPVRAMLGSTVRAEEVLRWIEGAGSATFEHTPDIMPDRLRMTRTLTVEPLKKKRCRVVLNANVRVKILGISGILEKFLASELPARQERAARWFNATAGD